MYVCFHGSLGMDKQLQNGLFQAPSARLLSPVDLS